MRSVNYGDDCLPERFWDKVTPEPNSGCWLWLGDRSSSGYGQTKLARKTKRAHRVAFIAVCGPVPDGMVLDHLCRTRCCVNPAHLEPVTPSENVRRGDSPRITAERNRSRKGLRVSHCRNGHEFSGDNLYVRPGTGARLCRTCQRDWQLRTGKIKAAA